MTINTKTDFVVSNQPQMPVPNTAGSSATERPLKLRSSKIAPKAQGLFMTMLAGAYADPIEAVIREILTNAIDAHTVVGQRSPVIMTLPTLANPTFTVADRGVGMTLAQLECNYADFGDSLKEEELETIGRYGIGAKSPYGVTNSFRVTTTQFGETIEALMTLGDDGLPAMGVLSHSFTGAPDGTTVTIPVEPGKLKTWRRKAVGVMQYVTPGLVEQVLLKPTEDEMPFGIPVPQSGRYVLPAVSTVRDWLLDDLSSQHLGWIDAQKLRSNDNSYRRVVMGNIGYTVPNMIARRYPGRSIFFAPLGSLELTHTREMIKESDHNIKVLDHIFESWQTEKLGPDLERVTAHNNRIDKIIEIRRTQQRFDGATADIVYEALSGSPARSVLSSARFENTYLRSPIVIYSAGYKRETSLHSSTETIAHLLAGAPSYNYNAANPDGDIPVILLDVGVAQNIDSTSLMSRLTRAVKRAREQEGMADLRVLAMSREDFTQAVAQCHQSDLEAYSRRPSALGGGDTAARPLPAADPDTLPWRNLGEFLTEHKPPRAARQPRGAAGTGTAGPAQGPALKKFFSIPGGGHGIHRVQLNRATELSDQEVSDQLDQAPSRTLVVANAEQYERRASFLFVMSPQGDGALKRWLGEQIHSVPIVHDTRISRERLAARFDAEVISLEEHLRRVCARLVAGEDPGALAQLANCQVELNKKIDFYQQMLTDDRLPADLREQIGTVIGDGTSLTFGDFLEIIDMARSLDAPEEGLTLNNSSQFLPEHVRGDQLAARWPLLAEIYSQSKRAPSDELLGLVLRNITW